MSALTSAGTPAAILFAGLVVGMVNALTATGIVLVYRTTRVINFAQTAIGAAGAALCFELIQLTPVPFPIAFVLGVAVAGGLGLLFDLVFGRRFFRAPRLVLTVLTIIVAEVLGQRAVDFVRALPFFPPLGQRSAAEIQGAQQLTGVLPFSGFHFQVGSFALRFGFAQLLAIAVSGALLVAIPVLLRTTRAGVAVRAMAENAERASLLGISVGLLSSLVWATAGVLSGASVTLSGLIDTPQQALGFAPEILLPALAAAVIGRMSSLGVTAFAAVAIAVAKAALSFHYPTHTGLLDVGLLLVVALGLLVQRRRRLRSEVAATTSWQATEEIRPIPRELSALGSVRNARVTLIGLLVLAAVVYPFITTTAQTNLGGVIALNAIVGLSLVVLTGWAGQVSLGQFAFAAVGAVVAGGIATHVGLSFWLAVPLATVVTAGVSTLVGIPALRIPGLFLAVTTFAFAVAVRAVLFDPSYFGWLLPGAIKRPDLFVVDFEDERSMYFLCVAALVLAILLMVRLRRSRVGRMLIAVRDNQNDAAAQALDPVRAKLIAFAVAGALAGFSGAVFAFQQRGVTAASFGVDASFGIFVMVVLGGVSTVAGALLGSAYINASTYLLSGYPIWATLIGPGGALYLLYIAPGGLVSLLVRVRDAGLRIIAQRHRLVVPSLFADVDPAALEARLAPLGKPVEGGGTAAVTVRYRLRESLLATDAGIGLREPAPRVVR